VGHKIFSKIGVLAGKKEMEMVLVFGSVQIVLSSPHEWVRHTPGQAGRGPQTWQEAKVKDGLSIYGQWLLKDTKGLRNPAEDP